MVVTAAAVTDTLRVLVPGFILLQTFYVFGLQIRRTDAQWVIWSIVAALPVIAATDVLLGLSARVFHTGRDANVTLLLALPIAVVGGLLLAFGWRTLTRRWPRIAAVAGVRAWDNVFGRSRSAKVSDPVTLSSGPPEWLQITLTNKIVYSGRPVYAARSVDTDDVDLYLIDPAIVVGTRSIALSGVEGVLVPRSQIASITVFSPKAT
jgi:uncharacterized protein DUF6338